MGTPGREPQEESRNITTRALIFYTTYYILVVPCLGFPLKSRYILGIGGLDSKVELPHKSPANGK